MVAIVAIAVATLAACGGSGGELPSEVTDALDIPNESLAILVDDSVLAEGSIEPVPRLDLLRATARARELGTELRFTIVGPDDELVDAQAVANRYGGVALSYKLGAERFFAAGNRMSQDQLDRALEAAKGQPDLGSFALAFVSVLEEDGGVIRPARVPTWTWMLLAVAVAFVLWQAWNLRRARRRAARRRRLFGERQEGLVEWAHLLGREVDALQPHWSTFEADRRDRLDECRAFLESVVPTVESAGAVGDLDAAEIRLARTAIKLRQLRADAGV